MASTKSPRQDQLKALAAKWIGAWAIAGAPGSGEFSIGFARVVRDGAGRFEFDHDGEPGMCIVALDGFCEAADIVATGRDWIASWLGRSAILGEQHVNGPRLDEAVAIFPTVLEWLKGDRQGIVLVDKPRAARELRDAGPFLAIGGIEHAGRLVALFTLPPPDVLVPIKDGERQAA